MTLKEIKDQLKRMLNHLEHEERVHTIKAKKLFPDHPKAQKLWVQLHSGAGAFEEIVAVLKLDSEYLEYGNSFDGYMDKGMTDSAVAELEGFKEYMDKQLKENFYLFT